MVDTFRRIGRVRAPSTSAGGNGVAAVPARAAPRINLGAGAKAGSAFGWGRVAHHRVPPPRRRAETGAWGAPGVPMRLKGVPSSNRGCCFSKRGLVAASSDTFDADDTIRFND